ncbi:MAG: PTS sugar transporter subunit IIA [Lachnospiraceae bacterium]|nr:PTS sugar transporter subunit IIA [Lachnospiraceae bacterium]
MELSKRQIQIVRAIAEADMLTASELSKKLNLSEKTVYNEIKAINREVYADGNLIKSKKGSGYYIEDKVFIYQNIENDKREENRRVMLLKYILVSENTDIGYLCDTYYVSEATLKRDVDRINERILSTFQVKIERVNNRLVLECGEKKKRSIMTHLLLEEIGGFNFRIAEYNNYFEFCELEDVKSFVDQFAFSYEIQFSDIEILILVLHLGLTIDRIKKGYSMTSSVLMEENENQREICIDFCKRLEKRYQIQLNEAEYHYVASLLWNNTVTLGQDEKRVQEFVDRVLREIDSFYGLDFAEDVELKKNILIHFLNLYNRLPKNGVKNPLIQEIKSQFPMIYDISVFLSMKFTEVFSYEISEDETCFLSMHLMCAVEKMKKPRYRVAVVDPIGSRNISYYQNRFSHNLPAYVLTVRSFSVYNLERICEFDPQLIISTVHLNLHFSAPVVCCSSLFNDEDIRHIAKKLEKLEEINKKNKLPISQFDRNLFFTHVKCKNKAEVITLLCDALVENGYCDEHYIDLVWEREQIAATCFGNHFAIPHPVKKTARRSGIAVAILEHPIEWSREHREVSLIFLFSLSENNTHVMQLFERIIELLDDAKKVKRICACDSYDEFVEEFMK